MNNILNFLGLMKKAGKLAYGDEACYDAVRTGRAKALLIASDASPNLINRAKGVRGGDKGRADNASRNKGGAWAASFEREPRRRGCLRQKIRAGADPETAAGMPDPDWKKRRSQKQKFRGGA